MTRLKSPTIRLAAAAVALAALALGVVLASPARAAAQEQDLPPGLVAQLLVDAEALTGEPAELQRAELVRWDVAGCREALGNGDFCDDGGTRGYVVWIVAGNEALRYQTDLVGNVIRLAERGLPVGNVQTASLPQSATVTWRTHTVRYGETLQDIARSFQASVWALALLNALADPDQIFAGDVLRIPSGPASLQGSAQGRYVVQPGDTLSAIALRAGVSVSAIAEANGITNPDRIQAGWQLVLPEPEPEATAAP